MINDYVSLNLEPYDGVRKRGWWRYWNQLSRLQRNLIYLIIFITLLSSLYFMREKTVKNVFEKNYGLEKTLEKNDQIQKPEDPKDDVRIEEILNMVATINEDEKLKVDKEEEVKKVELKEEKQQEEDNVVVQNEYSKGRKLGIKKFRGPVNNRQKSVVDAFKHAWKGYKAYAWGHDMLRPMSRSYHDWFSLGLTIIDALDTMIIMNLENEYAEARDWVSKELDFAVSREVNVFEVTIRVLGGLLSAYHLSNDTMLLEKATDLGTRLLPCFNTESGVPYSDVNLGTLEAYSPKWSPGSSTSEVSTIQLEFRDLSRSTGNKQFEGAAANVSVHIHNLRKTEGLVPIFINANTGEFRTHSTITLGARGDSYYEYLLKQWIQTGRTLNYLKDDYIEAINGIQNLLVRRTAKSKLLFVGELLAGGKDFKPKMDHLTCYLPGTLALGVMYGLPKHHMTLAEELLYTCYQTYAFHPTFLAPEITYFNILDSSQADIYVKSNDAHNLLRPEFVESLWVMYQINGNVTYQEWGWQVFQSIEKYTKVAHGYTSIGNVKNILNTRPRDMMESYFLGETLKYLYLLFSDNRYELSLKEFVINSEAHPLPIYKS